MLKNSNSHFNTRIADIHVFSLNLNIVRNTSADIDTQVSEFGLNLRDHIFGILQHQGTCLFKLEPYKWLLVTFVSTPWAAGRRVLSIVPIALIPHKI